MPPFPGGFFVAPAGDGGAACRVIATLFVAMQQICGAASVGAFDVIPGPGA
jgi:hypothetical protein